MIYFVDSICDVAQVKELKNVSPDRAVFRILNSDIKKPKCHAANKILRNAKGDVIAVRCNCGKKTYHPATEEKVFWHSFFTRKEIRMFRSKSIKTEKLMSITEDFC